MKNIKNRCMLKSEDGSVLVIAMIMLVLLTLIGISAITTSTIEVQISANERIYKMNLCVAEGASMECIQRLRGNEGNDIHTGHLADRRGQHKPERGHRARS